MKRLTLTVAVLFGFALALNAQTYVNTLDGNILPVGIPECFTNSGRSYVAFVAEGGSGVIYDNDLTTILATFEGESFDLFYDINRKAPGYYDWSTMGIPERSQWILFTQGLFNSDDNFEYLEMLPTCWNIKTLDGIVLQTVNTDNGCTTNGMVIVKMDNMFYLFLAQRQGENTNILIYHIDQALGLTKVDANLPISVFPTFANRSQQITVELGEGNNAKEITVVNGLGQVIKRIPLQEGQRQVIIPAQELNGGLNVVNTRTQQGQGSCKIIVR